MLIVKKDLVNIEFWIERVATCILNIYRISGIFHRDLFFLRDQINIMLYPILFAIRKYWIAKHDRRKLKKEKYFPKFRKYCNTRKKPSDIRYVVFTKLHHKLHCSNTPNSRLSRDHNYSWTNQRSSWFFFLGYERCCDQRMQIASGRTMTQAKEQIHTAKRGEI